MNWFDSFFYYKKDENSQKSEKFDSPPVVSDRRVFQDRVVFYIYSEWDIQVYLLKGFAFSKCLKFIDDCYDNNMSVEHTCSKLIEWFWSIGYPRQD